MSKKIVIVGAGFCGTLAAIHLLKSKSNSALQIMLIDRDEAGRGIAYAAGEKTHLLNVPAGSMSAFANDPEHFLRFAKSSDATAASADFLPRYVYGDYLQSLLRESIAEKNSNIEFSIVQGSVIDVHEREGLLHVELSDGQIVDADKVLLATGNTIPTDPSGLDAEFFRSSKRYIRDPWALQILDSIDRQQPMLLIGAGLTAVDVALSLGAKNFNQPIFALSRRGLTPLAHRGLSQEPHDVTLPASLFKSELQISAVLRQLRVLAKTAVVDGSNWRSLIGALRPHTPTMWQEKISDSERRRFLRHCLIYWDVHRHRLAPPVAASLQDLLLTKQLTINAGRLSHLYENESEGAVNVSWRVRGRSEVITTRVGTVINCTGPSNNLKHSTNPLLTALLQRGAISQDILQLGINVNDNYAVISANGNASTNIFYVGPFLKAKYWEATAVPELRAHVEKAVRHLLDSFDLSDSLDIIAAQ
ncbi:MAG: hypothetical protein JWM78_1099 [Verrucomicrobiaceae bacterium]|nr:hypothetical protein [Verrucomicrobiaceae bacterium]